MQPSNGTRQVNVRLPDEKKRAFHIACFHNSVAMQNYLTVCVDNLINFHTGALSRPEADHCKAMVERAKTLTEQAIRG